MDAQRTSLVTGGGGFLGGAIVRELLARGAAQRVLSVSRGAYPELEALGVTSLQHDLSAEPAPLVAFLREHAVDTVYHCAAKPGVWGPAASYERANVLGTERVIEACRAAGVKRLVFTSSPSAVFDGTDHVDAGPDVPYPTKYLAHYPRTKAEAERLALAANSPELATIALRPHLIFGPGDPNLVPRLLERADAGRLRIVGDGKRVVSLSYVDNAAHAHVIAADALEADGHAAPCAGRAYFVNQMEPVGLWAWINEVLTGTGRAAVTRKVPAGLAYGVGAACEFVYRVLGRTDDAKGEPPMTRFVAKQLATSHSYDMAPFVRDTGGRYVEPVPLVEATARTVSWARSQFALPSAPR